MIDHGSDNLILPGEINVERLLAHPELRREPIHRKTAVAVGEKIGARLSKNAFADFTHFRADRGLNRRLHKRRKLLRYL
jgi:hypothetical protein